MKDIDLATHHDVPTEPRCYKALAEPAINDGWLIDGGLLYRLTDDNKPVNRDEINVTMADSSRFPESRNRRARELLDRIRATQPNDIAELEHENRLLRARNERLQKLVDSIVPHLASWCGASAMPPKRMAEHITDWSAA